MAVVTLATAIAAALAAASPVPDAVDSGSDAVADACGPIHWAAAAVPVSPLFLAVMNLDQIAGVHNRPAHHLG